MAEHDRGGERRLQPEVRKLSTEEARRRVSEILEVVHLGHLTEHYPAELSDGRQQRVVLAWAVVVKPAVLLLGELLSNLDTCLREEMRFEIRRLNGEFCITGLCHAWPSGGDGDLRPDCDDE